MTAVINDTLAGAGTFVGHVAGSGQTWKNKAVPAGYTVLLASGNLEFKSNGFDVGPQSPFIIDAGVHDAYVITVGVRRKTGNAHNIGHQILFRQTPDKTIAGVTDGLQVAIGYVSSGGNNKSSLAIAGSVNFIPDAAFATEYNTFGFLTLTWADNALKVVTISINGDAIIIAYDGVTMLSGTLDGNALNDGSHNYVGLCSLPDNYTFQYVQPFKLDTINVDSLFNAPLITHIPVGTAASFTVVVEGCPTGCIVLDTSSLPAGVTVSATSVCWTNDWSTHTFTVTITVPANIAIGAYPLGVSVTGCTQVKNPSPIIDITPCHTFTSDETPSIVSFTDEPVSPECP